MANIYPFSINGCTEDEEAWERVGKRGVRAFELAQMKLPVVPGFAIDCRLTGKMDSQDVAGMLNEGLPQIEELPIKEMWVGFRPTSRDDAPILGPTAVDGLVVATGHHRNGVLLAPLTIDAVSAFMLDGTLSEAVEPFGIGRFNVDAAAKAGNEE